MCATSFEIRILTYDSSVRNRRICAVVLHDGRSASPAVGRSAPFARAAHVRPAARHPWRPSRPRRLAYRGNARRQTRGSPSCTDLSGCTRLRRGRTSRKRDAASRATFGKSDYPLSVRSCPRRRAAVYRNSSLLLTALLTF